MNQQDNPPFYGWQDSPKPVRDKVNGLVDFFRQSMGNNLTGVYLHGSLAMGCCNPKTSDIDLLLVISGPLTVPQKKDIVNHFQQADKDNAGMPPEMSIVTKESLKSLVYPSPFELHYSHSTQDVYTSGKVSWEEQRFDTDLVAHYKAILERGVGLYGKAFTELLSEVPEEMFLASITQDLHWISQQINSLPFSYVVLNPCRAMAYAGEGKFLSKKEGGDWALEHVPPPYTALIESALNAYSGAQTPSPPPQDILTGFLDYAVKEFIYLASKRDAENLFFKRSY